MILYNRKKVKYRKDGYCWKKRKDGKTTREDHMKLKVQGVEVKRREGFSLLSCKRRFRAAARPASLWGGVRCPSPPPPTASEFVKPLLTVPCSLLPPQSPLP